MSWIRLDDKIAHHPKMSSVGVSAWLWVCCLAHCQKYLTDGFISFAAVPSLAAGVSQPTTHIKKLVRAGLLDTVPNGYNVHDYLQFNDTAEVVNQKREADRQRKMSDRHPDGQSAVSGRIPKNVLARAPASHPIPPGSIVRNNKLVTTVSVSSKKVQKIKAVAAPPTNLKIITKIAHEILSSNGNGDHSDSDIREDLKSRCAKLHIGYDSVLCEKALESARVQQQKRKSH